MNPEDPRLAAAATQPALGDVTSSFLARLTANEVFRGTGDYAPVVTSIGATEAVVSDCYLDKSGVYDATSGARKDTPDTVRHQVTVTLAMVDGTWKVSRIQHEGDGCVPASS